MSDDAESFPSLATNAKEAVDKVDAQKWAATPLAKRIQLLQETRTLLGRHVNEIAQRMGEAHNVDDESSFSTKSQLMIICAPFLVTLQQILSYYQLCAEKGGDQSVIVESTMVKKVGGDLWDIMPLYLSTMETVIKGGRTEVLRVRSVEKPQAKNPLSKPPGIIAALGPGNYSCPVEVIRALYIENCAVVHKSHPINETVDHVWHHVLQPFVDYGVLSFCEANDGEALVKDERLTKIYFTGGSPRAEQIRKSSSATLVSECGGSSPVIIVPGDTLWTNAQMKHHANMLAYIAKINGGAICCRPQVYVTCKHWPQRQVFTEHVRRALLNDTPGFANWYPGAKERMEQFKKQYPNAEVLQPQGGTYKTADVLFVTNAAEGDYVCQNEAFCQVLAEVPLDIEVNAKTFLPKAVQVCNDKLLGSLNCTIIIDDATRKSCHDALLQAITDLRYGTVAVNTSPFPSFSSAYLIWGGNEAHLHHIESGQGNFGNLLGYDGAEKSILLESFISSSQLTFTSKGATDDLNVALRDYLTYPRLWTLVKLIYASVVGKMRSKDF